MKKQLCAIAFILGSVYAGAEVVQVGPQTDGSTIVTTRQAIRPAGAELRFRGRPVDLALSPDGAQALMKDNRGLVVADVATWTMRQELAIPEEAKTGGSMHGIAIAADGRSAWLSTAKNRIYEARIDDAGSWAWAGHIAIPGPNVDEESFPCGIALTGDGKLAFVCLSRNNSVAVIDLGARQLLRTIPVGVAPYHVALSEDESAIYVSNWGGRPVMEGERAEPSSGTKVLVDERGVGSSGTVSKILVADGQSVWQQETGLHPSSLVLAGEVLYVANVNSDTVTALRTNDGSVLQQIDVKAAAGMPFGAMPNALAFDAVTKMLYVACGGLNAVAVLATETTDAARVLGFIPSGWYPSALALGGGHLHIANVKGVGSRTPDAKRKGLHVKGFTGTANRVPLPDAAALAAHTQVAIESARVRESMAARERAEEQAHAVPVPKQPGQPSVIEHVFYIIKENRTYDQVFGDLPQGNGEPALCTFPRELTPNHHALAEEFVLLDNYYCNGVVSADGHSWATEGIVTDHLEKSFGGFSRSYTFGDDPLTYASSGFIWDNVMAVGKSFRNFGEFNTTELVPSTLRFPDVWKLYSNDKTIPPVQRFIGVERVKQHSAPEAVGWNMNIPDQYRADVFIRELTAAEATGTWPNFTMIYLPNDHTSGTKEDLPTPRAHIADNDLALGRIVEAISKSRFWGKSAIFVNEDDPQDGYDHVDGHRSICLVISPFAKRGKVISELYSQTSVLHTISLILGAAPMNLMDGASTPMWDCFARHAKDAPYTALPAGARLDELNKKVASLSGDAKHWALESARMDLSKPDRAEEDVLNRVVWHAMKGVDTKYPAAWAGAHGRGLAALGLAFGGEGDQEEEEEEHNDARGGIVREQGASES